MLDTLNSIGRRVTSWLGEPEANQPDINRPNTFSGDTLANLLPWEAYDEDYGIFLSQNSMGFTIEAIPLVGAVDAVQKEIHSIFQEILEEGDSLQCLLWADHRVQPFLKKWEQARHGSHEIYTKMAQNRVEHYLSSALSTRIFRFILSYSSQTTDSSQLEKLKNKRERILKTLKSFTYAFSWDIHQFLDTTSGLLNYSLSKEVQKRHWNPFQPLSSQLPSGGGRLKIDGDGLQWETDNQIHLTTFRVVDFPDAWSLTEMHSLIGDAMRDAFRIQEPFFLHYGVHCPKQSKEELNFKKRTHFIEKQGRSSVLLRMIPQLREELKEGDLIRKEMTEGTKFLWSQLSAGIWVAGNLLPQAEQTLKSLFRINQFTLKENRFLHLPSYLSYMPMAWGEYVHDLHELNLLRTTISKECAALVPIQGEWMGTPSPGMLLVGRRGQLVNWSPFDNKSGNYNAVVVGRSGSGKSVFMQDLIMNGLASGAKVFVLEVGRSFEKLCDLLDGQYIKFSKETNICLNPFSNIPLNDSEERDTAFSCLKSMISTMAAPSGEITDCENGLIEKAIRYAWESKNRQATITDVSMWLQGQYQPSKTEKKVFEHHQQQAATLGIMLTPYTQEGVYAKYFEGKNNADFTSPFVLIELEELKEKKDLQAVVLQLFIMAITNQAFLGDRKTRFYICIDEAWDLLRSKQSGIFIETLARRLRKYNGSLVIGTQSVDDFYSSPGALAAYENSDWTCLLAQKASSIARLAEGKKIDLDTMKTLALESVHTRHGEYSEILISDADGNYAITRMVLDPFSQLLYSTQAQDHAQIKALQKQGMSVSEAINHLNKKAKK